MHDRVQTCRTTHDLCFHCAVAHIIHLTAHHNDDSRCLRHAAHSQGGVQVNIYISQWDHPWQYTACNALLSYMFYIFAFYILYFFLFFINFVFLPFIYVLLMGNMTIWVWKILAPRCFGCYSIWPTILRVVSYFVTFTALYISRVTRVLNAHISIIWLFGWSV